MEPIKKVRLSEQVIEAIKNMIEKDGFEQGDKFYSENQLTTKLQVSRSSVREAVRILEANGYVTVKHGKGIYLCDTKVKEFEAFTNWLKENEPTILEHFEMRLILDPKAAGYAAEKADEEDISKMEAVIQDFILHAEDGNTAGLIKADEEFHELLARSTKNRTLHFLMKTMTKSLPEGWISSLHVPGRIQKTIGEHQRILEAIKQHNSAAAEMEMTEHLSKALREIRQSMKAAT
ncbi:MAG: FadR family transcriptional regulator [Spirochaetales bacterium]|nr:FadR family transcriptional regulator [Spirochaetales bacterium]